MVTVSNLASIDEIATAIGLTPKKTLKIIQKMIETSNTAFDFNNDFILFKNAQIDHLRNIIVLDANSANIKKTIFKNPFIKPQIPFVPKIPQKTDEQSSFDQKPVAQKKTVFCTACGAKNNIFEDIDSKCEYCSEPIN